MASAVLMLDAETRAMLRELVLNSRKVVQALTGEKMGNEPASPMPHTLVASQPSPIPVTGISHEELGVPSASEVHTVETGIGKMTVTIDKPKGDNG